MDTRFSTKIYAEICEIYALCFQLEKFHCHRRSYRSPSGHRNLNLNKLHLPKIMKNDADHCATMSEPKVWIWPGNDWPQINTVDRRFWMILHQNWLIAFQVTRFRATNGQVSNKSFETSLFFSVIKFKFKFVQNERSIWANLELVFYLLASNKDFIICVDKIAANTRVVYAPFISLYLFEQFHSAFHLLCKSSLVVLVQHWTSFGSIRLKVSFHEYLMIRLGWLFLCFVHAISMNSVH